MSSSSFVYPNLCVESPNVALVHDDQQQPQLESRYQFDQVRCQSDPQTNSIKATPMRTDITFRTRLLVPRVGVMLVGWGGNNGTTLTGAILANKFNLSFETKEGKVEPNYFGSITQSSTVQLGSTAEGQPMYLPMNKLLPMADPSELFLDGWDISGANLAAAMRRAKVLDVSLQAKLAPLMGQLKPRRAIFDPNFVAENQLERADNILDSTKLTKWQQLEQIRADIQQFKQKFALDKVLIVWTANTERYCELTDCHQSADRLLECLRTNSAECAEVSPSTLYALAAILSGCCYINGSPQNTFVPAVCELAERRAVFIAGDDFKSGQTKIKSVLVDFLVAAGIKPRSIVSYNHLGNNDGYNLSAPKQFRSKEISKSSVVDDMVQSNRLLFPEPQADQPDHCVVIKYVPHVGDSKRALDEYSSELMLGGSNTIVMHNTCEDSLLAAPLIIDLVLLAELCQRVQFSVGPKATIFQPFNSVLSLLAYLCKAPLVERQGGQVVNALFRQRQSIENLLRALVGLPPINNLDLRPKLSLSAQWTERVAPPVDSELNHKLNLVQLSSYLRAKPPVGPTQFQLEAKIQARAAAEDERALTRRIGPEFTSGH